MDDAAALRLTLRRCTAVLVVALGVIAANTSPYGPSYGYGYPLAYAALGYLAVSLLAGLFRLFGDPSDIEDAGTDAGDGGDSDGESNNEENDGKDDRPPVGTYSGPW